MDWFLEDRDLRHERVKFRGKQAANKLNEKPPSF